MIEFYCLIFHFSQPKNIDCRQDKKINIVVNFPSTGIYHPHIVIRIFPYPHFIIRGQLYLAETDGSSVGIPGPLTGLVRSAIVIFTFRISPSGRHA